MKVSVKVSVMVSECKDAYIYVDYKWEKGVNRILLRNLS